MKVRGDFLGPPRSTDKTTLIIKVSKVAKIRNRYNQVPDLKITLYKGISSIILAFTQNALVQRESVDSISITST